MNRLYGEARRREDGKPGTACLRKLPLNEKTTTTTTYVDSTLPPPSPLGAYASQPPKNLHLHHPGPLPPPLPSSRPVLPHADTYPPGIYDDDVSTQPDKINLRCTSPGRATDPAMSDRKLPWLLAAVNWMRRVRPPLRRCRKARSFRN